MDAIVAQSRWPTQTAPPGFWDVLPDIFGSGGATFKSRGDGGIRSGRDVFKAGAGVGYVDGENLPQGLGALGKGGKNVENSQMN
ncbi:MAG: hypothetical protein CM15mP120_20760 [Pseudomonadota bacterium]|nr:MAG: hypothetical protein CM15mP120_20760 [Pseudomonadota bacterium]